MRFSHTGLFSALRGGDLLAQNMKETTEKWDRLESLKALALNLADSLDDPDDSHSKAQLARQYRETLREIDEIEEGNGDDEIAKIIGRAGDGQPASD